MVTHHGTESEPKEPPSAFSADDNQHLAAPAAASAAAAMSASTSVASNQNSSSNNDTTTTTSNENNSASNDDDNNSDMKMARRLQAIEQLTSIFGFPQRVAEQAVEAVGFDATTCYNYILDNSLAEDGGGPVHPIDNCPHLQAHVRLDVRTLLKKLGGRRPQDMPCSHVSKSENKAVGGLKEDMQHDGSCPSKENWMCLECGVVRCSRYQNGHSLVHWEETRQQDEAGQGHCIAVSFSDLSVWCYLCNSYVKHPTLLAPLLKTLETLKFHGPPPPPQQPETNNNINSNSSPVPTRPIMQISNTHPAPSPMTPTRRSPTRKKPRTACIVSDDSEAASSLMMDNLITNTTETNNNNNNSTLGKGEQAAVMGVAAKLGEPPSEEDRMQTETEPETAPGEEEEDDEEEEEEEDENDEERKLPARGVPLNFDDDEEEGEDVFGDDDEADDNLIQMLAQAAAAQGISLDWIIEQARAEEQAVDNDGPVEYPFETLPTNLAAVAEYIQSDKCQRILILAGAGMSVASGIPDFRSSDGLYNTLEATSLTCTLAQQDAIRQDPSFALDQHLFLENPLPLLETKRDFILGTYEQRWKATLAHRFVELLHAKTGKLVRLYTQNIDGLEDQCTQIPEEKVIAVHGTMDRAECARCKMRASFGDFCQAVRHQIKDITGKDGTAPVESTPIACTHCGCHTLKPSIVLFRSSLPPDFFDNVGPDVANVDLLIVMGTSLKVAPANSLVWRVPRSAMRLLVNREIVGEHLGMDFDNGQRDYFARGNCDDVLLELMTHLGWLSDLESLLANQQLPQASAHLLQERLSKSHNGNSTAAFAINSGSNSQNNAASVSASCGDPDNPPAAQG